MKFNSTGSVESGRDTCLSTGRCFYFDSIENFVNTPTDTIVGRLTRGHQRDFFSLDATQGSAWREEIEILKQFVGKYIGRGMVVMEFSIPRMGRYIDVALIIDGVIFVIEFKAFKESFIKSDIEQVKEYVFDLHNFHEPSHERVLVPILMATDAKTVRNRYGFTDNRYIYEVLQSNAQSLESVVEKALANIEAQPPLDDKQWVCGRYFPTPDIIEVSRLLYSGHDVKEISRNDVAAESLAATTNTVMEIVKTAQEEGSKAICFVTGVPGAGKTLVGLNLASKHLTDERQLAVYLTGNFPLCAVLQEALAKDAVLRDKMKRKGSKGLTLTEARSDVKARIQMVHHYRDEGIRTMKTSGFEGLLAEHVAIFDEAQRSWTKEQLRNFMARKKGLSDFNVSEAGFLISCIDRHEDWGVVVCLVGGGQDINTGEAGIQEWFNALLKERFEDWHIYVSDRLEGGEYESGDAYGRLSMKETFHKTPQLHLSVSNRSFRAENMADFVHHLLDCNVSKAKEYFEKLTEYPIVLTRDINVAKEWLKKQSGMRGGRYGIVASSAGERLRPENLSVKLKANVVHWFLADKSDIRSSLFMEDIATEFDIQGLELDWV